MSNFVSRQPTRQGHDQRTRIHIHPIVGWFLGHRTAEPIIPTAAGQDYRVIAIGIITPDGVLWSNTVSAVHSPSSSGRTRLKEADFREFDFADMGKAF